MKKLTLFLLLAFFASVTLNAAKQYCGESMKDQSNNGYFITIKTTGTNTYQVIVEGSETATITGAYNINCGMNGGVDMSNGMWIYNSDGFGSVTRTFTYSGTPGVAGANDITLQKSTSTGSGDLLFAKLPTDADWTATCSAGPSDDTEAPVMTSASLVSNTHNSAIIAVAATDNVGVTNYVVYNNAAKQGEYTPSASKITVTGLTPSTSYTLTIKAKDAAGNESAEGKDVEVTTDDDPKADNTQCKGWNDDIWASQGGYTYDISTKENGDVVLVFTAMGELPTGIVSNPGFLFYPNAGDRIINGSLSGKVITCTVGGTVLAEVKRTDGTIHFKTRFTRAEGDDISGEYIYTVGEDCQPHSVTGVSITSTFTKIEVNQSMTMTAAVTPANATNKNVTWSITSGSEYASINSAGTVTGIAAGEVTVQVTTEDGNKTATKTITVVAAKPSAPSAAPDAPTHSANKVKAVYSATYSADCGFGEWSSGTTYTQDTYGKKYVMTGNGYFGMEIAAKGAGLNCSSMEYLHADVWVKDNKSIRFVPIHGGTEYGVTKQLTGGQWNSIDIALTEGDWANITNWSDVYQIKIDNAPYLTLWFNNVYFYTTSEETKYAVSAIAGDGGSATASASSVTSGTEVTFTATAEDCGYMFSSWTKGGEVIVGAGATYTTAITEETTLKANFTTTFAPVTPTHETTNVMTVYGHYGNQTGLNVAPSWGQLTAYNETTISDKKMARYTNINYQGLDFDNNRMDVSNMQYVHIDLYASVESDIRFSLIWAATEIAVTKHLKGCTMESLDIPLSEFTGADLTTIRQLKFDAKELPLAGKTLIVQNIYFYKLPPADVTGVSLDKTEATLKIGKTLTLTATVAPANAGNKNVTWSSDKKGVATVVNGVVTAVAEGTANITVTTEEGGFEATCAVTVNAGNPDEVELTKDNHTIVYTAYIVAENTYELTLTSEENLDNLTTGCYWHVNGQNEEQMVAKIVTDSDPKQIVVRTISTSAPQMYTPLYILMPGEVNFGQPTFTWIDKRPVVAVESVTINNAPETMNINEQVALTATVAPAEVINKNVTWSITAGNTFAEIDGNGILTAKSSGEITVQATSVADDTKSDSKTITITSQEAEPKVFYGCASKDEIDILYSITFNVDRTITYTAQINHNKTGLVPQICVTGSGISQMTDMGDDKYQYTTEDKFLAGTEMNSGFFYMAYQETPGNTRIDFTYTVGAENVLISEKWDNAARIEATATKTTNALLDRTFIADGFNYTLCLPFDMTAEQCLDAFGEGYKLFLLGAPYMKTTDVMYLPFSEVTAIEAGKPYLFCPASDVVTPTIAGVTIDAEASTTIGNEYATMTGIYSPTEVDASNYVLGDDNWLYQSDGEEMYGLRCYFTFGSGVSQNVRARAVFHNTDVVTDLETVDGSQCTMRDGKYVINGQFVIIRNGKQYNALGF